MENTVAPCKGCRYEDGRSPTCHATCERYDAWKKERDKFLEKMRKIKAKEKDIYDFIDGSKYRMQRKPRD